MTTLISFDVDGTLIRSVGEKANHLHKEAFSYCFKAVFGIDTHIDTIQHHGGTDPLIIMKVLENSGIAGEEVMERLPDLQAAMCTYFEENANMAGEGLEVLGGVTELLQALQVRGDVMTCLVTGNMEPIGWGKMQAVGLKHLFSEPNFGGFGSDHCSGNTAEMWHDRAELIRIAGRKAAEHSQDGIKAHYHVGDTPQDLYAAAAAGVNGVGVATGIFSRQELDDLNTGAVILAGLEGIDAVLQAMGLASPVDEQ
eukprot:CAMPEP_0117651544 /NCGR_PEP_ID=MMETSP0804-20121206/2151_1 /TAXON_ID=1074897 /ORGANISM="Tetraselmis astigmatica, Strain CCMP880" /LENGTH=253 /DNA_ID=CAMNT_0005457533 /DNA_START=58 /DNA_END=819 /DNA_ORIENTATION=+